MALGLNLYTVLLAMVATRLYSAWLEARGLPR